MRRGFRHVLSWECAIILPVMCVALSSTPNVTIIGPPVVIWAAVDTLHACGIIDVPDIPARQFLDVEGRAHVICGSTTFRRMEGPSVLNVTRNCTAAWNQTASPDPSLFAGDEASSAGSNHVSRSLTVSFRYPCIVLMTCTRLRLEQHAPYRDIPVLC